ncbi:MAG: SusC/RagA family TonB-linked outer membrane protein [Pseudopedobacter saltans]|uniref:SusC/RagA family TonB-linked outer membrane protein n=1 Tax=Pseudopedobacter saltans TaxID=151895 RepID=A0A2W5HAM1_9SPHI|nr:MAG: SusC/RagA family TonB-linked outer membrane protein [Pseudopedobacter saltans]
MKIKNKSMNHSFKFFLVLLFSMLGSYIFGQNKTSTDIRVLVASQKDSAMGNATVILHTKNANSTIKQEAKTDANGVVTFKGISISNLYDITVELVGYEDYSRENYKPNQGRINSIIIKLKKKVELDNIIVTTALGIRKRSRSLGYAITKIDSSQLTDAVSTNWVDALSGKVAGLHLIRSGGGPDASAKIILRGENNLTGDNEALVVVDGVVINNSSGKRSANGSDNVYATNSDNLPADYGSSLNDINPQDIESVTVLKGPAAAALYGQRAANGAILITTKSSHQRKKGQFNVNYVMNGNIEQMNRHPDMQYEYGQGLGGANYYSYGASLDGASTSGTSSAYGPRFDGQEFFQYDPVLQAVGTQRTEWKAYNNINDFFLTGTNFRNNLSVDGRIFGNTTIRLTMGMENNKWLVPNTGFGRKNIGLSTNTEVSKKFKISTKINYGYRNSDNLPGAGYGNQSIMYWYIFWQPSADFNWLRNYWAGGEGSQYDSLYKYIRYPFSSYPENPYAVTYEFLNKTKRSNVTGNVMLNYQLTKNISFMGRYNLDWSNDDREQDRPYDAGVRLPKGSVRKQRIRSQEQSYDIMGTFKKDLNQNLNLGVTLGGSQLWNRYGKTDVRADGLIYPTDLNGKSPYPEMYNFDNSLYGLGYVPDTSRYQINSLYGVVNLSFKNVWFTEFTARNDWNSVLAAKGRREGGVGFFYPSINTSLVLSDILRLPASVSYLKVRASLAQVGSGGTTPYRTLYAYQLARVSSGGTYPDSSVMAPTTIPNVNLQPLKTTTFEVGAEAQFFHNRLGIDLALYTGSTNNQILTRIVDAASGYTRATINAGRVRNRGIEVQLDGKPIVGKKFKWDVMGTFSYNQNTIMSMPDSSVVLQTGPVGGAQIVANVGGSMGDLYGLGYQRVTDKNSPYYGQVLFDPTTGFPLITDSVKHLGNTIPKFKFSLGHTLSYKQFSFHALFDAQLGGIAYSHTWNKMAEQGKLTATLPGRYNGIVGDGALQNPDGSYRKNDVVATDIDQYYQHSMGSYNAEGSIFSTNFVKFREATIGYAFDRKFLKKIGLSSASIAIYGRDLFIWSPWPIFDPEFGTMQGSDIVRGFEIAQFPSTRSMGFNLTVGF